MDAGMGAAALAIDAGPMPQTSGKSFLKVLWGGLTDLARAVAGNKTLLDLLLTVAILAAVLLLTLLTLRLFKRLARRKVQGGAPRPLRFRKWTIASAEQVAKGLTRALLYARIIALAGIAVMTIWILSLVLVPRLSGQAFTLAGAAWFALVSLLAWWGAIQVFRGLGSYLLSSIEKKERAIKPLRYHSFTILPAPIIEKTLIGAVKLAGWISLLLSLAMMTGLVLSYFSFTWSWSQALLALFIQAVAPILSSILAYLPKLLFAIIIIALARFLLKLLKAFFKEIEAGRLAFSHFDREWAPTTFKLLKLLVFAMTAVMVFPYIPGSGSEAFRSVGIFLGVLLSLGSSSFIGNVLAGISLSYMKSYRIGDRVKIGEIIGDIEEQTLLITRIRTIKNVVVTVPNSVVLAREVENFSPRPSQAPLILHTSITIGYEVPWQEVHAALLSATSEVRGLLADPPPFILQVALDNYSVNYELNASTDEPRRMAAIYSDLHRSIQDSFARAGIEIMTPSYYALRDGSASTLPRRGDSSLD